MKNSNFKIKTKMNKNNILSLFILMLLPNIIFYYIAQDWGRWMNISYTLSLLTYLYLYKNNYIEVNNKVNNYKILKKNFLLIMLFIVFSFGWNPKTTMKEDVGSIPIYRKTLSIINFIF